MNLKIPNHIAIVMDGNGRWAQHRGRPRVYGHIRGASRVKAVIQEASKLGVKALTLYAFSTENWSRPDSERKVLWKLLKKYLLQEADELHQQNVRLRVIGEMARLDADVQEGLKAVMRRLENNTGLQLTFALSYGSRREWVDVARRLAEDCLAGRISLDAISESLVDQYLWTSDLKEFSDVDLFIRTSGEVRVSNFLLWQSAYAEFVFTDVCWPDFSVEDLRSAVEKYSRRDRRFGALAKAELAKVESPGLV